MAAPSVNVVRRIRLNRLAFVGAMTASSALFVYKAAGSWSPASPRVRLLGCVGAVTVAVLVGTAHYAAAGAHRRLEGIGGTKHAVSVLVPAGVLVGLVIPSLGVDARFVSFSLSAGLAIGFTLFVLDAWRRYPTRLAARGSHRHERP